MLIKNLRVLLHRAFSFAVPEEAAALSQDGRLSADDPLIAVLQRALGKLTGKLRVSDAYLICGIEAGNAPVHQLARFDKAIRQLGWERQRRRFGSDLEHAYVKGLDTEREVELRVEYDRGGRGARIEPTATHSPKRLYAHIRRAIGVAATVVQRWAGEAARPEEDPIAAVLHQALASRTGSLSVADAFRLCGITAGTATADQVKRVSLALRMLGWERGRRRLGDQLCYVYAKGTLEERACQLTVHDSKQYGAQVGEVLAQPRD